MLYEQGAAPGKDMLNRTRRGIVATVVAALLSGCTSPITPAHQTAVQSKAAPTATAVYISGPVVRDPAIVSIRMFDQDNGWAVSQQQILRTADGAATWHDVSPHAEASFGYAVSAYFLDNLHGWVLVPNSDDLLRGILYRSGDGGLTWSQSPVPFGGGNIQFLDEKQGWMMADLGAGAGSMAVSIFQTSDAGASWIQTFTDDPTKTGASESLPLGGLKNGIWATSMQAAWIGGVTYAPGTVYLFETKDSGRSWEKSRIAAPTGYEQAELETTGPVFLSTSTAYLPVHIASQNGVLLAVYVTHDGGDNWLQSPAYVPQGGVSEFLSETAGFAWNGSSFYVTNDSAQTWTAVTPDVTFSDGFAGMDFVSPRIGYVLFDDGAGNRQLYKTFDGGQTWNTLGQ
jgi:photosystem II stability/assembly factor-like uncharacterized protein